MRFFFFSLILLLLFSGCGGSALETSPYGSANADGIVIDRTVDPTNAESLPHTPPVRMSAEFLVYPPGTDSILIYMSVSEDTAIPASYGSRWYLEAYENHAWRSVPFREMETWPDLAYSLGQETESFTVDLTRLDHAFGPGKYRILKEFDGVMYAAEFTIQEDLS